MLTRTFFFSIGMQFYDLSNQYKARFPYIYAYSQVKSIWPALYHLLLFQFCSVQTKPLSVADVSQLTAIIYIPLLSNATEFLHFNDRLTAKPFFLFKILLLLLRIKSIKLLSFSHKENQILCSRYNAVNSRLCYAASLSHTQSMIFPGLEKTGISSAYKHAWKYMIAELAEGISISSKN